MTWQKSTDDLVTQGIRGWKEGHGSPVVGKKVLEGREREMGACYF